MNGIFFPEHHPRRWGRLLPGVGGPTKILFPALFYGATTKIPEKGVTCLPVTHEVLALPNMTLYVSFILMASCYITEHIVSALQVRTELWTRYHALLLREGRGDIWCRNVQNAHTDMEEAMYNAPDIVAHRLQRGIKTVAWLSVPLSTANDKDLGGQEWCNFLFLRYIIKSPDIPPNYNGFGTTFSIYHSLGCRKDGLVTTCHRKICYRVSELSVKVFTSLYARYNPLINPGRAV